MSEDLKISRATGKVPLDLLPIQALYGMARVLEYGAYKKYKPGNYLRASVKDGACARYIGGALRHLSAMQTLSGVVTPESTCAVDSESNQHHLDHAICGLVMLRAILIKDGLMSADPGPSP